MRNRRTIIIAFLLCATLLVGVGYATIAEVLDVDGTAEYGFTGGFDGKIQFTEAFNFNTTGNTASLTATNEDKVTFTATSVNDIGEVAYFRFKLENSNATEGIIYLSNYLYSQTVSNASGGIVETNQSVYKVEYWFNEVCYDEENDVAAQHNTSNFTTATPGAQGYVQNAETNYTLEDGDSVYLYIAVSFSGDLPSGTNTVSATFGLEYSVWSDALGAANP